MKNQSVDILQCIVQIFSKFFKKDVGMKQFGRNLRTIGIIYLSRYQEAAQAFCALFLRALPTKIQFHFAAKFSGQSP